MVVAGLLSTSEPVDDLQVLSVIVSLVGNAKGVFAPWAPVGVNAIR